jgi:hypothetical protein
VPSPQRSVDSVSQGSSSSSFSSTVVSVRQEEARKDYREVSLRAECGREPVGLPLGQQLASSLTRCWVGQLLPCHS